MKVRKSVFFGLLALALACVIPVFGQSDRGAISGTVTDPSGALVANAKVTVTNINTGDSRETKTTSEGAYSVQELIAAPYRVTVEAPGFKTATLDNIQVGVQVTRNASVKLEIGVGESVTVNDTSVLQLDTPVKQLNVTEKQVRELPLVVAAESGGRSPLSFIFLDSSVIPTTTNSQGTNATSFRVNGGQGLGTDILIDGAGTRRGENGTYFSEVAPGPNAFQEFTISTSQYSAEFGNSSGGVVNFTIKSGGNDFHGEAYAFFINEALNANIDLNRIRGIPRPRDRQKDFGFSVGGPVYLPRFGEGGKTYYSGKNKTFFFFNYGGYRTNQAEAVDVSVPTDKMRMGDFSELLTDPYILNYFGGPVKIYDPRQAPGQRTAFPGNIIPASALSPAGLNILALFPHANQRGPNGSTVYHNYRASSQAVATTNYYVGKINQVISEKQQLSFSFTYRILPSDKGGFPRRSDDSLFIAQGRWKQQFKSYYARLGYDYTLTPNLLNHFNAGFSRSDVQNRNASSHKATASSLGIPAGSTQNFGYPLVGFPGYGSEVTSTDPRALQPWGSTFFDNEVGDNTVQLTDFATYTHGRHTIKGGADVRIQQLNNAAHFDIGGNFNFRSNQTANTNDGKEGWPIASLITGRPEFSFNSNQTVDPGFRFFNPSGFVQDDIKVTPKLTVNVGIRYDVNRPRIEAHDRYRGFDPSVANPAAGGRLGAIVGAGGQGGLKAQYRGLAKTDYSDIGPRVGFAYALNDKTVVRGGYGLYYAPILYSDFGNSGLVGYNTGGPNINGGLDATITLDNYLPLGKPDPNGQVLGTDVDYFNKNFKLGRTAQYSLDIQRQLPYNLALQVGFVGNKGTRLRSNIYPLNALSPNALKLGNTLLRKSVADLTALDRSYAQSVGITLPSSPDAVYPGFNGNVAQALKPFPQYGRINSQLESEGQSSYNALKVDLQRRFSQGFQFGVSYTFSKLITDAGEDLFGATPLTGVLQNPFDRASLRTISPNNPPHSLVINYIAELPFGKGKRFLNQGGLTDRVFGGFQISAILRYRSGPALVPFVAGGARDFLDLVGYGGNLRPNVTGQPFIIPDTPTADNTIRYVNPAAFSRPADFGVAPAFTIVSNGQTVLNPAYAAYYANPSVFFGNAAPAYNNLRGKPFYGEDLSILKKTRLTETTFFEIRAEFFNLFNRGRFGLPDVNVDNTRNFGNAGRNADIFQPRRIQVGGRFIF